MTPFRRHEDGSLTAKGIVIILLVISGIIVSLFYIQLMPSVTREKVTKGRIVFYDSAYRPLTGMITISGTGMTEGHQENVSTVNWNEVPNAVIDFNAIDHNGISINLRIDDDSPYGGVMIQDYSSGKPGSIDIPAPGEPIKYVEIEANNVNFALANVTFLYTDDDILNMNETDLALYIFDHDAQDWKELITWIDTDNNTISAAVDMMSVFALGQRISGITPYVINKPVLTTIQVRDSKGTPVEGYLRTYDENNDLKTEEKTNAVSTLHIFGNGELEVDALDSKRIAVKLKVISANDGHVILEDYGKNNPVLVAVPGTAVKYVEISAENINFSSATISIRYNETELESASENNLTMYHWNGSWEGLPTVIDAVNNILTANTTSLSPYAISAFQPEVWVSNETSNNTDTTTALTEPDYFHSLDVTDGGADCISCHEYIEGGNATSNTTINASSMRYGVHANLNSNTTNSTPLDPLNKACWACHGDGLEPPGHPANYANPWTCIDCHNRTAAFTSNNTTVQYDITRKKTYEHIQYPYNESINSTVWNLSVTCTFCHSKSMVNFTDSVTAAYPLSANVSHYTNTSNLISPSINCALCHKSSTNSTQWKANLTRHPANTQDVSYCANCHNTTNATDLHDTSLVRRISVHGGVEKHSLPSKFIGFDWEKDDFNDTGLDGFNESCVACHSTYITSICVPCHYSNYSIRPPKLCESCHLPDTASQFTGPYRNASYNLRIDINDTLPRVYAHTNYSSITDVIIPAQKGDNKYYFTTCYSYYQAGVIVKTCHGTPYANLSDFGGYYAQAGVYVIKDGFFLRGNPAHFTQTIDRMPDTANCLFCHNQSNATIQQGWASPIQVNASSMFGNRYDVNNTSCYACHTRNSTTPDDFHSNEVVKGGGPGCLECHNNSNPQNFTAVDGTPLAYIDGRNFSTSIHSKLNSNNASGYGINASCWGCHNSSGTAVMNNTHPDRRDTPFTCPDCHLSGGTGEGAYNAPIIYNHYKNGTSIRALTNRTNDTASCMGCHENISGMITPNNDSDTGSFATDRIGAKGGNISFYHYGENRSHFNIEAGSYDYCIYCHRNSSGEFSIVFADAANMSISNHSLGYNSTNPSCSVFDCHNATTSTLHRISIRKPDINITLHNTSYCLGCHGINSAGNGTNYTEAITSYKETHNNSVSCTECHLNSSRSIHPVLYLKDINNTWNTSKTDAVNCTNCHQNATFWPGAPLIPDAVKHSSNSSNGSMWNSTETPYWTGQDSACYYCHDNTKHNSTALGRISALLSSINTKNSAITTTRWCADCHYNTSNPTYKGNLSQWSPTPPLITINNTGNSMWKDHSDYFYSGYNDTYCLDCHPMNNTTAVLTSFNYSHSLDPSTEGNADCISCHEYGASGAAPPNKRINASSMRSGVHANLNSNTTNSTPLDPLNKACWACHGDGLEPGGHPANYANPWTCAACHNRTAAFTSSNTTVQYDMTRKKTYEHIQYPYNESINSTVWNLSVTCTFCHSKSMVNFTDSVTAADTLSANVSHYTNTSNLISPSINCTLCHKSSTNSTQWKANLTRHPANTQDVSYCANCHNTTNATGLHDTSLVKTTSVHGGAEKHYLPSKFIGFDWEKDDFNDTGLDGVNESCVACHSTYITSICVPCHYSNFSTRPPKLCESCHLPDTASQFTGPYRNASYNLRSDINDTLPRVYAHTSYPSITDVIIPAQKGDNKYYFTTCYSYYQAGVIVKTCHGAPYENRFDFGGYYAHNNNLFLRGNPAHFTQTIDRMPDTANCLFCHNQSSSTVRQGWASPIQVNASSMFGNRYDVNNTSCYICHTRNGTTPDDFHSNEVVKGGGPGCLECHNNSNPQNFTAVDGTPLASIDGRNFSASIHSKLNSNNASGYGINASCWGCHNSSGTAVMNNTHPDRRDAPFTCPDCHLAGGTGAGAYNAPIIYNHYKNGTGIRALTNRTNDTASCVGCHENISGMITGNNDSDTGSFATDGIGAKGGNTSFYHYGDNRSHFNIEAGSYDYCIYCHRNSSGEFSIVFEDAENMSISNHSLGYNSTNPSCSVFDCHNATNSTLHGISIRKPDINITLHNTSYCLSCHGINPGGNGTNYTEAITSYKEEHNNSVSCTECHTGWNKKNIHPIKYLQPDGSFAAGNQTGINCTGCHQQSTADPLLLLLPPKIANPMHHSDSASNGTAWNSIGYWTAGSPITSCIYCHGDSRHNVSGLGRPVFWKGDNTINSSIDSGNWCSSCHYQDYSDGADNYIDMTAAFTSANLQVPPEITNGTYAPYNFTCYYNHSLTNYSDAACKLCHGSNISEDAGISAFIHQITMGSCTSCHYSLDAMNSSNRPDRYVDSEIYNASLHSSLNCQNCHTRGHNNIGYRKACEDCHAVQTDAINDRDRHMITANPGTNIYNGESVVNITDCTVCHDPILLNNSRNTYGYGKIKDCDYCHTYPDKYYN